MPEYPDITIYIERLEALVVGQPLEQIRFASPFFLRTAQPPIKTIHGATVRGIERMGKRIIFVFSGERFLVIHLMVAGRLHWRKKACKLPGKVGLAVFDFPNNSLLISEAGTKKRASLHLINGRDELAGFDPGGLEVFEASLEEFRSALLAENHTLKRSLTDPHIFSGIGNTFSDEILHRARLSPILLTEKLAEDQIKRLYHATRATLEEWTQRLRDEVGNGFPDKVTAFRENMAVHGRFNKPCPECGTAVQRIRYASSETNYCPLCQTGGKLFADRAMSRLLKKDWPRTLEELEVRKLKLIRNLADERLNNK
ncbi:Formamidopyrimidine-DNA glycosylase (EC [Olavius sp. associated proteobacterium Delta 1]|nr:Formamidopyrimidine-DNA glycosylase (EC [Olavius sp. associated proteobacterium Delta 1]